MPSARTLDPTILARLRALELHARQIVEGHLSGMHRSPRHGFAVEFAQHREYTPGDDVKHVDWKVYARSGRYFLKQYEQDTDLTAWFLVDASESMTYASNGISKYDFACRAVAALAHMIVLQADRAGLVTFDDRVRRLLKPATHTGHLNELLRTLVERPTAQPTKLGSVLHELSGRLNRRGLVMLFSDLFDDVPAVLAGLRHLRHARHDVIVFHVLDPDEIEFPFEAATMFRGLEEAGELLTDPRSLRASYQAEIAEFRRELERGCRGLNIDLVLLRSDRDLGLDLARYLARRS